MLGKVKRSKGRCPQRSSTARLLLEKIRADRPLECLYTINKATIVQAGGTWHKSFAVFRYTTVLTDFKGTGLLLQHNNSAASLIITEYVEHAWKPWKFARTPRQWWRKLSQSFSQGDPKAYTVVRLFMDEIGEKLNITHHKDWIYVKDRDLQQTGAFTQVQYLGGLASIVFRLYPELQTQLDKTHTHSQLDSSRLWSFELARDRRTYLEALGIQLSGEEPLRWGVMYAISKQTIVRTGGSQLLKMYSGSPAWAIITEFPEHAWTPWKFVKSPKGWWEMLADSFLAGHPAAETTVREYLEYLAQAYNVQTLSQWCTVPMRLEKTDSNRLAHFGGLMKLLTRLYPKHNWNTASASSNVTPLSPVLEEIKSQLKGASSAREYFDALATRIDFESMYLLEYADILNTGGLKYISPHGSSVAMAIMHAFPQHMWKPWKFTQTPRGWWSDLVDEFHRGSASAEATVATYLDDLAAQHGVKSLSDWYTVSREQFGETVLEHLDMLGCLSNVLRRIHPDHPWDFRLRGKSAQINLRRHMDSLLPTENGEPIAK